MQEQGKERGLKSRTDQNDNVKKGKSYLLGIVLLIWGIGAVMNTEADPSDSVAEEIMEEPVMLAEEGGVDTKSKVEKPTTSSSNSQIASKIMKDGRRWTTENLNINVRGSYCYDDKDSNCSKYGRLYTWEAAKTACKRLGSGWRLPSDKEWEKLAMAYGGLIRQNGGKYEDIDNPKASYKSLLRGGTSGFAALLGGYRDSYGSYYLESVDGFYWSSTEYSSGRAWYYYFSSGSGRPYRSNLYKTIAFSCRCIQD